MASRKSVQKTTQESKLLYGHLRYNASSSQLHGRALPLNKKPFLRSVGGPKGRPDGRVSGGRPLSSGETLECPQPTGVRSAPIANTDHFPCHSIVSHLTVSSDSRMW